ncbi:MAG TPA: hypothetical protein VEX60_03010 [Pyrinomonadaceae bacterium]|nr:hypothetical protein [Pyrinomonadaceae bacterium]
MASRLTVIFYIILCLEAGIFLTVLPWWQPWGMGDWGDNYFLVFAAQKIGFVSLQRAVASGWVRGAVTGLGLLNLAMALWEIFHFRETVRKLQGLDRSNVAAPQSKASLPRTDADDAAQAARANHVSHHERRDD